MPRKPITKGDLKSALGLVRKHVNGFTADDGYDLRGKLDARRVQKVLTMAGKLRELLASPHDLVRVPTRTRIKTETRKKGRKTIKVRKKVRVPDVKAKKSLTQFTQQRIRNAKHFIVHKPADNFKVGLDRGNVFIQGNFGRRVVTRSSFYLFPRRPRYPNELVAMSRRMLKSMPDGFYVMLTAAHGDTGEPFDKGQLINRLNDYLMAYEVDEHGLPTGFSEALIGFRFMSTTLDGAITQRSQISARRERIREARVKAEKMAKKKVSKKCTKKKSRKSRRGK